MNTQDRVDFKRAIWISAILLAYMFALSIWGYAQLPDGAKVPIHWSIQGKADGFASAKSFFVWPAIALFVTILLAILPRFESRRANLLRSSKAYEAVWITLSVFFAGVQTVIVLAGIGGAVDVVVVMEAMMAVLFIVIGNYLGKVRSNTMFGIRTPWTLASELSWNRTHRVFGRVWVAAGVLTLAAVAIAPDAYWLAMLMLVGGTAGSSLWAFAYSRRVWEADPQRKPASWREFLRQGWRVSGR